MSKKSIRITYCADDGYVGGNRPLHMEFTEDDFDLDDFDTEEDMIAFFWETVQEDFEQRVQAASNDENKFVKWIKELKETS